MPHACVGVIAPLTPPSVHAQGPWKLCFKVDRSGVYRPPSLMIELSYFTINHRWGPFLILILSSLCGCICRRTVRFKIPEEEATISDM